LSCGVIENVWTEARCPLAYELGKGTLHMPSRSRVWMLLLPLCLGAALASVGYAQNPAPQPTQPNPQAGPRYTLDDGLKVVHKSLDVLGKIQDYSCTFIKRERVDGQLTDYSYIDMKLRHEPFSVYMYFQQPTSIRGQEALYVQGKNNNKLIGHTVGIQGALVGTLHLDPAGALAMRGNRYAITMCGMKKLLEKLVELSKTKVQARDCEVRFFTGASVDNRPCTVLKLTSPGRIEGFPLAHAMLYMDDEWHVPVRFECYEYPTRPRNAEPILVEEYTYTNVRFNQNFTDADFSDSNPKYKFK